MSEYDKRVSFIKSGLAEGKSKNQVYQEMKHSEIGMRKQDFYVLSHKIEGTKRKSKTERTSNIPLKYALKKPEIELPPLPSGTYRIAKLKNKRTGEKYFIKFTNKEHFDEQAGIIMTKYNVSMQDFKLNVSKEYTYTPFIAPDFDLSFLEAD